MATSVPNPYRCAIIAGRASSASGREIVETALDRVVAAFELGAWVGGVADQVYAELAGLRQDARAVARGADDEFVSAIDNQPEMVDADAWQVRWRNV